MPVVGVRDVFEGVKEYLDLPGFVPAVLFDPCAYPERPQDLCVPLDHAVGRAQKRDIASANAPRDLGVLVPDLAFPVLQERLDPHRRPRGSLSAGADIFRGIDDLERIQRALEIRLRRQSRVRIPEQAFPHRVDPRHQGLRSPPVEGQRLARLRVLFLELPEQPRVGILEPHDRLLDVPDDQRRDPGLLDLPKEGELERIGILELVDHQAVDTAFQDRKDVGPLREDLVGTRQHVRKIDQARLSLLLTIGSETILARPQKGRNVRYRVGQRPRVSRKRRRRVHHVAREILVPRRDLSPSSRNAQLPQG